MKSKQLVIYKISIFYLHFYYRAKLKHLFPFHDKNNELKEIKY